MVHVIPFVEREDEFDQLDILCRCGARLVLDDIDEENVDAPSYLIKKVSGLSQYGRAVYPLRCY